MVAADAAAEGSAARGGTAVPGVDSSAGTAAVVGSGDAAGDDDGHVDAGIVAEGTRKDDTGRAAVGEIAAADWGTDHSVWRIVAAAAAAAGSSTDPGFGTVVAGLHSIAVAAAVESCQSRTSSAHCRQSYRRAAFLR